MRILSALKADHASGTFVLQGAAPVITESSGSSTPPQSELNYTGGARAVGGSNVKDVESEVKPESIRDERSVLFAIFGAIGFVVVAGVAASFAFRYRARRLEPYADMGEEEAEANPEDERGVVSLDSDATLI